jgi:hypothetical protein
MVGVVTFGARKAGRRGGSGFVFAWGAGSADSIVLSGSSGNDASIQTPPGMK